MSDGTDIGRRPSRAPRPAAVAVNPNPTATPAAAATVINARRLTGLGKYPFFATSAMRDSIDAICSPLEFTVASANG